MAKGPLIFVKALLLLHKYANDAPNHALHHNGIQTALSKVDILLS
jgi:hypothetical protein